jgi:putative oxidoreductase
LEELPKLIISNIRRTVMDTLFLIGRIIFGGYFIFNGINHFMKINMMSGYAKMKGVPFPFFSVAMTGLLLLLGGLSVLFGVYTSIGLGLLIIFLFPVTFMMHNFWTVHDPQMKMGEMVNFMKNIALLGAVLMLLASPVPWPLSL